MTARAIADAVLAIEDQVFDQDWCYQGIDVWPLYRNEMRRRLALHLLGSATEDPKVPRLLDLIPAPVRRGHEGGGMVNPCTVVMTNGLSLQKVGDGVVDRLCTPICLGLDRQGTANILFDQSLPSVKQLASRVEPVGAAVARAKIAAVAAARLAVIPWVAQRCEALALAAAAVDLAPSAMPDGRAMSARQGAMFSLADFFGRRLTRFKAERVLQVCFYTVAGFAMNLAAHRAGIASIDIQHGVIDPDHTAYVRWPRLPEGGYALMPTGYWTWGEDEARILRQDLKLGEGAVVVGGHPLIEAWRNGWLSGTASARTEMRALRSSRPGDIHALVTLQPGLMSAETLRPLIDAMSAGGSVFWWIRAHPMSLNDLPAIAAVLGNTGAQFDIANATRLPLYALLEVVDFHMTHSSSTVIEAAQFGVPSLVWSRYGEELFAAQILVGAAQAGEDGEAVLAFMRSNRVSAAHQVANAGEGRLMPALTALLDGAGAGLA